MTSLVVTYPVTPGASFDAGYYVETHLPLVDAHWVRYGLTSARVLLAEGNQPYAAIAILDFRDAAALDAALASPEAATVFGDVPNFTDIKPVAMRCGCGGASGTRRHPLDRHSAKAGMTVMANISTPPICLLTLGNSTHHPHTHPERDNAPPVEAA